MTMAAMHASAAGTHGATSNAASLRGRCLALGSLTAACHGDIPIADAPDPLDLLGLVISLFPPGFYARLLMLERSILATSPENLQIVAPLAAELDNSGRNQGRPVSRPIGWTETPM
jgi:hypothetical protein